MVDAARSDKALHLRSVVRLRRIGALLYEGLRPKHTVIFNFAETLRIGPG